MKLNFSFIGCFFFFLIFSSSCFGQSKTKIAKSAYTFVKKYVDDMDWGTLKVIGELAWTAYENNYSLVIFEGKEGNFTNERLLTLNQSPTGEQIGGTKTKYLYYLLPKHRLHTYTTYSNTFLGWQHLNTKAINTNTLLHWIKI